MSTVMSHNLPPIRRIRRACLIEKSGTGIRCGDRRFCRRAFRPDRSRYAAGFSRSRLKALLQMKHYAMPTIERGGMG